MILPNLSRHGIVEAHAGTGKTYTIVAMVLDLLERERLELREILLVTYTQKAAGELVERIRKGIEARITQTENDTLRTHLHECLGQLGECWIGTIHGVALRILRTWPFESGLPFHTELVDDPEGLDGVMRAVWRRDPWSLSGEEVAVLRGGRTMEDILESARQIALDGLDPDSVILPAEHDTPGALDAIRSERAECKGECEQLLARIAASEPDVLALLATVLAEARELDTSSFKGDLDTRWRNALSNWEACISASRVRSRFKLLGKGKRLAEVLKKTDALNPEASRAAELWDRVEIAWRGNLEVSCERLTELEKAILPLDTRLRALILSGWAATAANEWREQKLSEGLLSYQDMLERLRDAVRNEPFRRELRKRVQVGIIDEFQDTSALQWDIFRLWFVQDNADFRPRLFLVGDPKQSIYSFQGADVRTYLRACRDLEDAGGSRFALRHNWRSTDALISAQNALLGASTWFPEGIHYDATNEVLAPQRANPPHPTANDWIGPPVRIVPLDGAAGARRAAWARHVAGTIGEMRGRSVLLPMGSGWQERVLDWGDFAVAIQTRSSVTPFRRAFRRAGIPFSLYKEAGVFASRAALEFSALLSAVAEPNSAHRCKLRALLTRFFGVGPETADPARHLAADAPASLVFERLSRLAQQGRWSTLFQEALSATGAQERILSGRDGDRDWMDLRQTMTHALEFLVLGRGGLPELVEHLGRLRSGDDTASEDRNLHARATDHQRVQLLTMHVSKGLEFPVVFLAPNQDPGTRETSRWIDEVDGRLRVHAAPKAHGAPPIAADQTREETERLLYVAITRPKLLLSAPLFTKKGKPENTLDRHLAAVIGTGCAGIVVEDASQAPLPPSRQAPGANPAPAPLRRDVGTLRLADRSHVLSSYSALSRASHAFVLEGRPNRAEEQTESGNPEPKQDLPDAWLPRGAASGDALHETLESLLRREDLTWCRDAATPPDWLLRQAESALSGNGLDPSIAPSVARLALDILSSPMPLPAGDAVRLCDLPRSHRRPEVEFHCAFDDHGALLLPGVNSAPRRGWLVGYIDLLFRHGKDWYVLDWKTTTLPSWEPDALDQGMREHDYLLQASLYARVLASARPQVTCGGAVYVFLRASAGRVAGDHPLPGVWTSTASGLEGPLVASRLEGWLRSRRNPSYRAVAP